MLELTRAISSMLSTAQHLPGYVARAIFVGLGFSRHRRRERTHRDHGAIQGNGARIVGGDIVIDAREIAQCAVGPDDPSRPSLSRPCE